MGPNVVVGPKIAGAMENPNHRNLSHKIGFCIGFNCFGQFWEGQKPQKYNTESYKLILGVSGLTKYQNVHFLMNYLFNESII